MIETRELKTIAEMEQVQELENKVWGAEIVPTHQTLTAVKNGGIIVGAFAGQQLVGFSYGFAGFHNGKSYLCSHMLGIDQPYRSKGIGAMLKLKQREIAIEKGYDRMQWTYDPLETRNAYLNLTKLNGICDTYIENCYGEMKDGLNKGLPSDRFEIHWHLTSPYVIDKQLPNIENPVTLSRLTGIRSRRRNGINESRLYYGCS
jgi:predicted GNAT superfamily acetyltransferase